MNCTVLRDGMQELACQCMASNKTAPAVPIPMAARVATLISPPLQLSHRHKKFL